MTERLYMLRAVSDLSRLLCGGPVYLTHITRSGRETKWTPDPTKARTFTAAERDALCRKFPRQMTGRWLRARHAEGKQ